MFAKLFETDLGQILVKIDSYETDDLMEVRLFFEPEDLGVCSMVLTFKNYDEAEQAFLKIDQELATSMVGKCINSLNNVSK